MDRKEQKRQERTLEKLDNEYTIKFTVRELRTIHSYLFFDRLPNPNHPGDQGQLRAYNVVDGKILFDVLRKIEPFTVIETNIPQGVPVPPQKPNGVVKTMPPLKPTLDLGQAPDVEREASRKAEEEKKLPN